MTTENLTSDAAGAKPDLARRSMFTRGTAAAIGVGVATLAASNTASASTSFPSYLSVKDYGAIGDGVANDTVAVNAAITAAVNGSTIYFPQGNYRIASALLINKSIKLMGDYQGGSKLSFYQNTSGILVRPPGASGGINSVEIAHLGIYGVARVAGTAGIDATATSLANGIGYLTLDSVDVALFDIGIKLYYNQMTSLQRVHSYFNNHGVFTKRCVANSIVNCIFERNDICGIRIDGDAGAEAQSCGTLMVASLITGNGTASVDSGDAIILYNENFEITACTFDGPAGTYVLRVIGCHRASVAQCWIGFGTSTGSGIYITSSPEIIVSHNNFSNAAAFGVALESATNCTVIGNTFRDGYNVDVLIYGTGSANNIVTANQCLGRTAVPSIQDIGPNKTLCTGNVVKVAPFLDPSSINANNMVI